MLRLACLESTGIIYKNCQDSPITLLSRLSRQDLPVKTSLSRFAHQVFPVKTRLSRLARQDSTNNDKTCTSILYKQWQDLYVNTLQTPSKNTVKTRPLRLACQGLIKTIYKHCQESPVKTLQKMKRLECHDSTNTIYKHCKDSPVKTQPSRLQQTMTRLVHQDYTNIIVKTRPSRLAYKTLKILTRLLRQDSTNNDKTFMSRFYKHCQDSPVKTLETMKRIKHQDCNIIYKYCPDLPVKIRQLKTFILRL